MTTYKAARSSSRRGPSFARAAKAGLVAAGIAVLLSSCTSTQSPKTVAKVTTKRPKEYFSESAYGVKASPRVSSARTNLRRGGGREQVGKPYKVRGRWYYPREEPGYSRSGKASWYGSAFHGRLTANGEVYDMTHLTAAHPTMPLPSYARVTNLANGSSVIVRVNDRGPYAHGRIIDLSQKAAEMLDYTRSGVAEVRVDYVGRAPLHGADDQYLLASYQPAGSAVPPLPQPSSDVMIAMNGTTPVTAATPAALAVSMTEQGAVTPQPQPAGLRESLPADAADTGGVVPAAAAPSLPDLGPIIMEKPQTGSPVMAALGGTTVFAYADARVASSHTGGTAAIGKMLGQSGAEAGAPVRILVATFGDSKKFEAAVKRVGATASRTHAERDGKDTTLYLEARSLEDADRLLQIAWDAGYRDAMAIRD